MSLIHGFLDRLPKIEEELDVREVLTDVSKCDPHVPLARGPVFLADFERLLTLISLYAERTGQKDAQASVVLSRSLASCPTKIEFSTRLQDSEPKLREPLPKLLSVGVKAYGCSARYLANVNPVTIFTHANRKRSMPVRLRYTPSARLGQQVHK